MVTFILWVAVIGTALCALIFLTIIGLVIFDLCAALRRRRNREVLPYPDTSAERMYDINYFYRANGRTDK